jgi:hypothetical protein
LVPKAGGHWQKEPFWGSLPRVRLWWIMLSVGLGLQAAESVSPEGLEFFEKRIRPVLVANCYECHSAEQAKRKGGLLLDSRAAILAGGDSGPAAVLAQPENSLLVRAIHRVDNDLKMPPKKNLQPDQIRDFETWIRMGLPDPRIAPAPTFRTPISASDAVSERQFWSYQPVRSPAPPVSRSTGLARNPIDQFVLATLDYHGLSPNPEADRTTLIRRATFDLTGLPPTPAEIEIFLRDPSPDAYDRLVDRLLDSPRFGEQFGRHWLDLVRYADTAGDSSDYPIPQAARYRDYVVDSFNADKPYDQFLREQIAGDLLPWTDRAERNEHLVATGFIALSRRFGTDEGQFELTVDDTIDTFSKSVLGLSVSCARCHDHKFDAISQRDYYALYGIFKSTRYPFPGAETDQRPHDLVPLIPQDEADPLLKPTRDQLTQLDETIKKLSSGKPAGESSADELNRLKQRRRELLDEQPRIPSAFAVAEGHPADAPIFLRGEKWRVGDSVPRGFLAVLGGQTLPPGSTQSGRLELVQWVTDPANPLTARVMANRICQWLLGRGLVATPNDFGRRGRAPSHPELLDYLASRLTHDSWSVKALARLVAKSRTYRESSAAYGPNLMADPDNSLLWRFNRRRLSAEELRDSALSAAGKLDLDPGVTHPFPPTSRWNFTQHFQFTANYPTDKRSLYLMRQRIQRQPFLALFDGADPNASTPDRPPTTSPLQALYFLNSPRAHELSSAFADRVLRAANNPADQIELAWKLAFGRTPTGEEQASTLDYLTRASSTRTAWESLARALLATNEFAFVD